MSLDELSANELSLIDSVCLEYESRIRRGESPEIEEMVAAYRGNHRQELCNELEQVRQELLNSTDADTMASTGADSTTTRYFDTAQLPEAGTLVGPYAIGEMLGRGGMGVVFAATDTRLDRKVAIKLLAVEIAKRRDLTERFEREARAVAAISHPNIVELFDVGVAEGLPYAVMELLDGELMDERLQRGRIDAEEVRRIGAQIADALATAHEAGVVHRDLKPHNIMLVPRSGGELSQSWDAATDTGPTIVKLFDFGLARAPHSGFTGSVEETGDGVILGTPGYMAPEQARGEVVTPSADIFSLGCVLYEAFYGKRAFDGRTKAKRFSATLSHHPQPDPIRRRDDVELGDLIQQCLEKSAADRPASAATIARQLRGGDAGHDSHARSAGTAGRAGNLTRRRIIALAGGGLAGVVAASLLVRGDGDDELTSIRSLAVLSFADDSPAPASSTAMPEPIGDSELHRGELLSALLVHELARLSEVRVPPFRPIVADTTAQFQELGDRLEVDAFLTGRTRVIQQGTTEFLELDVQIVSARTGEQLWGRSFQSETGDNLLQQSRVATEIASVIGHRLTSTADEAAPPSVESFSCLVDGETRADPDSQQGLKMALMCFEKAREVDRKFAAPVAGIALTSIILAAQTDINTSMELIVRARESAEEAIRLDPNSVNANLARAMLDWQIVGHYREADRDFQELIMTAPNRWQVQHQYGLLQLATGRTSEAIRSLREASLLNPMSVLVKVDWARAHWFSGNQERAIRDAIRIRDRYENNGFARGLLVDIYEHQNRFTEAAAQHDSFTLPPNATSEQYAAERQLRLSELPYGPFGVESNTAILQTRTAGGIDDNALAELMDPLPPMLRLLIAAHPSFGAVRLLPRAKEDLLPSDLAGIT